MSKTEFLISLYQCVHLNKWIFSCSSPKTHSLSLNLLFPSYLTANLSAPTWSLYLQSKDHNHFYLFHYHPGTSLLYLPTPRNSVLTDLLLLLPQHGLLARIIFFLRSVNSCHIYSTLQWLLVSQRLKSKVTVPSSLGRYERPIVT